MQIAHDASQELERQHNRAARAAVFGQPEADHTLPELLTQMHRLRERTWSRKHSEDQDRRRRYWLEKLGNVPIAQITEAIVETAAGEDAERRAWSPNNHAKYMIYMAEAMSFAHVKLKWIPADRMMTSLDLPKRTGQSKPYSLDEIRRLLPALESVDPRAGWIGHVAWQSGRRLAAIRTLPTSAIEVRGGHTVLHFPEDTDKARKSGDVVIVGRAHELTVALLSDADHFLGDPPPSHEQCIKGWIKRAEQQAGIPYVRGRGFHGIKRRYATETHGLRGRDKQSGTLATTLDRRYVQDDLEPKREVATQMAALLNDDGTRH